MVVGASLHGERGQCLLYRSADGHHWAERGALFTAPELEMGRMWECPNFFPVGERRWVLTVSVWPNLGALWFVGRFEDERFVPEARGVLDPDGGAFAHLTMTAPDGRCLQWAWLNEQREQAALDAAGWAGALSVPREIGVDAQGRLLQAPARELLALRGPEAAQGRRAFAGRCLDLEAHFTLHDARPAGLTLLSTPDGAETTRIVFNPEARRLTVERARSSLDAGTRRQDVHGFLALERGETLRLRVLVDHSVVEVFANERLVLSTRVYPTRDDSVHGAAWLDGAGEVALQAWPLRPTLPLRSPA
jgi:beta-fructofuranosidase